MAKRHPYLHSLLYVLAIPSLLAQEDPLTPEQEAALLTLTEILNTPVVAATKTSKKLNEAPGIISVITSADIARSGARNLADVLKFSTGFQLWTQSTGRVYAWVRGVKADQNTKILLVVDGVPCREVIYSEWGLEYDMPLINVDRIEIIRGPGSALYGGQAYSGVISVSTKQTFTASQVAAGAGTHSSRFAEALVAHQVGHWGFLASAHGFMSDGYPMERDLNGNPTDKRMEQDGKAVFLKLDHSSGFQFEYLVTRFETAEPLRPLGSQRPNTWQRQRGQLGYETVLSESAQVSIKVFSELNKQDERVLDDTLVPGQAIKTQSKLLETSLYGFMAQNILNFGDGGTLVLGAYAENQQVNKMLTEELAPKYSISGWVDPDGTNIPGDNTVKKTNYAVFGQHDWRPIPWMGVTAGLRYDRYQTFGDNLSPRIGLVFNPTETLAAKVLWGKAFNPPNIRQFYARKTNHKNDGNPNLKPEKATTLETELSYRFPKWVVAKVTAFQDTFHDVIDAPGKGPFVNLPGFQRTGGFEGEINAEFMIGSGWLSSVSFFANGTRLASAYNEIAGLRSPITLVARTIYNSGFALRGPHRLFNVALNHVGARTGSDIYHSTGKLTHKDYRDRKSRLSPT